MMERTMSDGSLARLLTADHLHEDLGSSETKLMVTILSQTTLIRID